MYSLDHVLLFNILNITSLQEVFDGIYLHNTYLQMYPYTNAHDITVPFFEEIFAQSEKESL